MKFSLKNKHEILPQLLGNIDWLDISYYMQKQSDGKYSVSGTSDLLLCFDSSLLDSLYKFDQNSASYSTDQTDVGDHICTNLTVEMVSDNLLKIEADYDFIRCFSFNKTSLEIIKAAAFVSAEKSSIIDFENDELRNVFSKQELDILRNSSLLGVTINNNTQTAIDDKNASRSKKLPSYVKYASILNNKINYSTTSITLVDKLGNSVIVPIYTDSDLSSDQYQKNNKSFTVINDSTISLRFLFYIDVSSDSYIIDSNDININYHVNVDSTNNVVLNTGIYNLKLYEKSDINIFPIDKIIYIKDIYNDEIIAIGKINNVTNNILSVTGLQAKVSSYTILNMDQFVVEKCCDMSSFSTAFNNSLIYNLITNNTFVIDDIVFDEKDFMLKNELY